MLKLLTVILLFAPGAVMAQSEVCTSSITVFTVTIASHVATQVDSPAVVMAGRTWVEYQNISTNTVHCAAQASLATTSSGRLLAADGGAWAINIADKWSRLINSLTSPFGTKEDHPLTMYCISSGVNVTSKLVLSQCK